MKIIITGATGSLGAYLTRHFAAKGHEIIACGRDKNPPPNLLKYASYFYADIMQPFQFPEADICIHAAALSDDKASAEQLYIPNVLGTKHVAEASKHCKQFIHVSSSSVYLPEQEPISEKLAGKQDNKELSPYGKSKLLAEEMLLKTTSHSSCFILRARAFYGIVDRVIMPRVLKLVKNNVFSRPGTMDINVSLTSFENFAHAIELCIQSEKKGIYIYNVADDEKYVFIDVIRKIIKQLYKEPVKEKGVSIYLLKALALFQIGGITPLLVRSFTKDMVLDISKIKAELGYNPKTNFYKSLPELANWINKIGGVEVLKTGKKELAWEE